MIRLFCTVLSIPACELSELHNPNVLKCPVCTKKPTVQLVKIMARDSHMTFGILEDWYILNHVISQECFFVVMARKQLRKMITDPACLYNRYTLIAHDE